MKQKTKHCCFLISVLLLSVLAFGSQPIMAQEIELPDPAIKVHDPVQNDPYYAHLYTGMESEGSELYTSWYHYCVEETREGKFVKKIFHPERNEQMDQITFADKKLKIKEGLSIHWYDNGNKICHGHYKDNWMDGEWKYYHYENDSLFAKGAFMKSRKFGLWKYWHSNGSIRAKIHYHAGELHGDFEWFDEEGILNYRGNYEHGSLTFEEKLIDGEWTTNYEGQLTDPYLLGCEGMSNEERKTCSDDRILEYMYAHIDYPHVAREQEIEGLALFRVNIDAAGRIESVIPMRGLSNAITRECISLLAQLPAFHPATLDGEEIPSSFRVPIRFIVQ